MKNPRTFRSHIIRTSTRLHCIAHVLWMHSTICVHVCMYSSSSSTGLNALVCLCRHVICALLNFCIKLSKGCTYTNALVPLSLSAVQVRRMHSTERTMNPPRNDAAHTHTDFPAACHSRRRSARFRSSMPLPAAAAARRTF